MTTADVSTNPGIIDQTAETRPVDPAALASEPLTIQQLVYGGDGLGRLPDGRVVFVPFSVPGDQLQVSLQPGSKPLTGQLTHIDVPGAERVTPQCGVFGTCGGCQWQHLSVAAQRRWKQAIVRESLTRVGKLPDVAVADILPAGDAHGWHTRNHVQWAWSDGDADGAPRLGYFHRKSQAMVAFDHCWIMPEDLHPLAEALTRTLPRGAGLQRIHVRQNVDGQWLLGFYGESLDTAALAPAAETLAAVFPRLVGMVAVPGSARRKTMKHLHGQPYLMETVAGCRFRVSLGSFFQTNLPVAEQLLAWLHETLRDTLGTTPVARAVDLYAGVGLFALGLHDLARRWHAVEQDPEATSDCRGNALLNERRVTLHAGDIRRSLSSAPLADEDTQFDLAIVDPPRAGCTPEVLDWMTAHVRRAVAYVSCDPTTLARDLRRLVDAGWAVAQVQPFDLFPQTYHVETVAVLVRPQTPAE